MTNEAQNFRQNKNSLKENLINTNGTKEIAQKMKNWYA